MESKSREQFDQYLKSQQLKPVGWIRDEYWKIWQASRAALVVEMPSYQKLSSDAPHQALQIRAIVESTISECSESIREAGITVKGEGDEKANL